MKTDQSGKWKVESGMMKAGDFPFRLSHFPFRSAMTLIELMITVVILVTLIGAVLPLVSPNNDARKIAEAARGLQTYLMQAQAEAARTGRPVGVGFRETSPGSGVAIEAFQMVVPKPYPGSSSLSRVGVAALPAADKDSFYSVDSVPSGSLSPGSDDDLLFTQFINAQIYAVTGRMAMRDGNGNLVGDALPPGMFRVGDIIEAQGNRFVIVDDHRHEVTRNADQLSFLNPAAQAAPFENVLFCVRLDEIRLGNKVQPLGVPQGGYAYAIHRQPLGSDETGGGGRSDRMMSSSEPAFQLPAGVCIDLQASGIEAGGGPETFSESWETTGRPYAKQIGLMFSPNGGIDGVWFNGDTVTSVFRSGNKIADISRIFLLLGRVENQNPQFASFNMDGKILSADELRDVRSKVNWLNPDSRWMMITANDGRFAVSQNAMFDPTNTDLYPDEMGNLTADEQKEATKIAQIEAAHGLGHEH